MDGSRPQGTDQDPGTNRSSAGQIRAPRGELGTCRTNTGPLERIRTPHGTSQGPTGRTTASWDRPGSRGINQGPRVRSGPWGPNQGPARRIKVLRTDHGPTQPKVGFKINYRCVTIQLWRDFGVRNTFLEVATLKTQKIAFLYTPLTSDKTRSWKKNHKKGLKNHTNQGCARLINQRQHDSSYRPSAMDSSPQLPSGTNYTTSTIVPRSNRTHCR